MSEKVMRALRDMARRQMVVVMTTGTVKAVNGMACDVEPSDGGPVFHSVRLKVALNSETKGVYAVPMVGSQCVIGVLDRNLNNAILLQAERIERYVIRLDGGAEIEARPNGVVAINGEQYGGLVRWAELRTELQKVNNMLQALKNAVNSWAPVSGDGGAAFKAVLSSMVVPSQLPTYPDNIMSDKTKHGSL